MQLNVQSQHPMTEEAVKTATGKTWEEWYSLLDERGGTAKGRRDITNYLYAECKLDVWWSSTLSVEYEAARGIRERDGRLKGYYICSTKTINAPLDQVYASWVDAAAWTQWLDPNSTAEIVDGGRFALPGGGTGEFKRVRMDKDIRFTWEHPSCDGTSVVDVLFSDKGKGKTAVYVNHDRIQSRAEADGLREAWNEALARLKVCLEG